MKAPMKTSSRLPAAMALCLSLGLGLSACADNSAPPVSYKPLDYSYLPPIYLKVSGINVRNNYVPDPTAATLLGQDPEPPANALLDMATHRLLANGTPGTASFTVENASITEIGGNLVGALTVRLDVISADGRSKGFTEASVSHSQTAPDPGDAAKMQAALYSMTKQLMDAMNVQFQYQLQHNLGSWATYSNNAASAPLVPGGGPGLPSGLTSGPAGGIQATPLEAPGTSQAPAPSLVPPALNPPTGLSQGGLVAPTVIPH